eukprot:3021412-Rhodomonas_salina.2
MVVSSYVYSWKALVGASKFPLFFFLEVHVRVSMTMVMLVGEHKADECVVGWGWARRIEQVYKLKLVKQGGWMDIKGKGFMHTFFLATPAAALHLDANGNPCAKCCTVTE